MILVCFAVPEEARPYRRQAPSHVRVLVTGMGREASEKSLNAVLQSSRPELVLTCGFAGGLNPALAPLSVLYSADEETVARKLEQAGARPARFLCADRVFVTAREKAEAWQSTSADAVEMESGHIGAICARLSVPCATVRVVLDPADASLPVDFNAVMDRDYRLRPLRMAREIAARPTAIPGLIRLGRQSRVAAERLAEVLLQVTRA